MKKIKLGVEHIPCLVNPGNITDYLDKFIAQLIYSPLSSNIVSLEVVGSKINIKVNELLNHLGLRLDLTFLVSRILNKISTSSGIFYGIKNVIKIADNYIQFDYDFKNISFFKSMLSEHFFLVGDVENFTGFFYPKIWTEEVKILSPNKFHPYWNENDFFEIEVVMNGPKEFKTNIQNDLIDVVFHAQFDIIDFLPPEFDVLNWKTPLKYVLISSIPILSKVDLTKNNFTLDDRFVQKVGFFATAINVSEKIYNEKLNQSIKLYFTNFYPNIEVCESLSRCFKAHGIETCMLEKDYREFLKMELKESDVKLSILSLDYGNPFLFYLAMLRFVKNGFKRPYLEEVTNYLMSETQIDINVCSKLESLIIESGIILPFMEINSKQIVRKSLKDEWKKLMLSSNAGRIHI